MQDKCSFCGRSRNEVDLLIAGTDGFICDACATQAFEIVKEEMKSKSTLNLDKIEIKKPREIKAFLDQYVIGQDEAKKHIAVAVYNHYNRISSWSEGRVPVKPYSPGQSLRCCMFPLLS